MIKSTVFQSVSNDFRTYFINVMHKMSAKFNFPYANGCVKMHALNCIIRMCFVQIRKSLNETQWILVHWTRRINVNTLLQIHFDLKCQQTANGKECKAFSWVWTTYSTEFIVFTLECCKVLSLCENVVRS